MARWVKTALAVAVGVVVVLALGIAAAAAVGSSRFRARYQGEKAELLRRGRAAPARTVDPQAMAGLPPPVRRYLEVAGVAGRPVPKVAVLQQRGSLRAAADVPWVPFESEQAYAFDPPGFVWLADARVAPLVDLMARDAFVDGKGSMIIRLLGAFGVADGRGTEFDQGAGLRYWGEIVSFPETVLDPRARWAPLDDRRARMDVDQDGLKLTAVIEFDEAGFPSAIHGERYRDVKGVGVLTPWSGRMRGWRVIDGRRFPAEWESVWHLEAGDFTAVRIECLSIRAE